MAEAAVRVFIALPLSPDAKRYLAEVQQEVQRAIGGPGVRWVNDAGMHLTLKFLGDTPTSRLPAVEQALRQAAQGAHAIPLHLTELGAFPNPRRPRVLWAGLGGQIAQVQRLFQELEEHLSAARFPKETRPLSAHITLGRVADIIAPDALRRLTVALAHTPPFDPAPAFSIEEVILYQSTLTPRGAIYKALATAPFP